MLVFGGFLLSSTNSCCGSDKNKRNNKNEDYEGIDFTFLSGSIVFPRLSPVLQQENNDIVEAVMATYSDLPQYAPVHDEVAAIAGTLPVTKPETRDVCLSPIHQAHDVEIPVNIGEKENDTSRLENETVTQQCYLDSGERSRNDETRSLIGSRDDRRLACSAMDTQALPDQNDNQRYRSKSAPLETTHDKNTQQEVLSLDTSRDSLGSVAKPDDCNDVDRCSADSRGSYSKPCDGGSSADDRVTTSLIDEFQIQKGIGEILPGQGILDASYQWKRPNKLSKKDKLEILKRLQPRIDDGVSHKRVDEKKDRQTENNKSKSEGNDVNRFCEGCSSDSAVMLNDGHCAKGGRLSRLKVIRAPSALCIHGNQCQVQCKTTGHVTVVDNPHLNDSGRGASCFAESFIHSTSTIREASAFGEPTRGASAFGKPGTESRDSKPRDIKPDFYHLTDVRGASSFDGTNHKPPENVIRTYGETTSCWLTGVSGQDTNDMRGASGFGESCDRLSVAGTASVTLSMAVQSEKEDFIEDNDSLENIVTKNHEDGVAKQPKEENFEGGTERIILEEKNVRNNEQERGDENKENFFFAKIHGGDVVHNVSELRKEATKKDCLERSVDVNVQSNPLAQHDAQGSLRDNIIKKKAIEVIRTRSKGGLAEDGPNRSSTPNDGQSELHPGTATSRDYPRMSLGKDPLALTGMLRALQREKHKKTINMKEVIPTSLQNGSPSQENGSLENANINATRKDESRSKQLVGKIKVCLFYARSDTDKPVLYATVLKAYSLRHEYVRPKEDFLVEMLVITRDNSTQKSKIIKEYKNSLVFNHLFHVASIKTRELQISALKLKLVRGRSHECVGIANVPLADLVSRDKIKKTYLLRRATSASYDIPSTGLSTPVPVGAVCIGLKYNSVEEKLLVHVIKVRGLPAVSSTGETDPYVLVTLKDAGNVLEERMTVTKWQQRNPVFDVKYVFELNSNRIETSLLLLRVINNAANHSLIGTVKLGMDSLEDTGWCHWNSIVTKPGVLEERWHKLINETSDRKIQTQSRRS